MSEAESRLLRASWSKAFGTSRSERGPVGFAKGADEEVGELSMRLVAVLALLIAGACSPYNYGKEIAAASTGVDNLSTAYKAGYEGLAADRNALTQRLLIEDRARVALTPNCRLAAGTIAASKAPCTLRRISVDLPPPPRPSLADTDDDEQSKEKVRKVLEVLKDYVHALAAVTNAADRAEYDSAVAQLVEATKAFSALGPVGTMVPPAVNIVGWVVGTALDLQRYNSLKSAVIAVGTPGPDGSTPIHAVLSTLALGLENLGNNRRRVLNQEADIVAWRLGPQLGEDAYRRRLDEVQALITALEGLRRANPKETTDKLEKAHDDLVAAVKDPSRSYASFAKAVGQFVDQATALKTAFSATGAPAVTSKKGE